MPNQPDYKKRQFKFWIDDEMFAKFRKKAQQVKLDMTHMLVGYISSLIEDVELTPEENAKLIEERNKRRKKQCTK